MDKQLKQLGSNAREMKTVLQQDLKALQLQIENVNGAIEVLDQLEANLGKIGGTKSNGKRPVKRRRRASNHPSYTQLLDKFASKKKPFTRHDFAEFVGKHVKNPSEGGMSQAIALRLNTGKLKPAGTSKPIKIGTRVTTLKLYKAA